MAGPAGLRLSDYEVEAAPAYLALTHGDVGASSRCRPAYGGSLIMRAPFALPRTGSAGERWRSSATSAVPCLLAGAALGVVLAATCSPAAPGAAPWRSWSRCARPTRSRCARSTSGIPRSCSARALCVGAVLAALRGRPTGPALLLGLAVANKAWAVLAVGPVLLALPARRLRALAIAGGDRARVRAPVLLAGAPAVTPGVRARADRRDLPALAGVVVLRLGRAR